MPITRPSYGATAREVVRVRVVPPGCVRVATHHVAGSRASPRSRCGAFRAVFETPKPRFKLANERHDWIKLECEETCKVKEEEQWPGI